MTQSLQRTTKAGYLPAEGSRADSKLILPFINATRKVFSRMMKMDVDIDTPFVRQNSVTAHDVTSLVGFSGEMVGSLIISFDSDSASEFVAAFTGMKFPTSSADFADAVGELANIIAGDAKKDLGGVSNITIPTVVIGRGHSITTLSDVPCVVIPCQCPVGTFTIEVNIKSVK